MVKNAAKQSDQDKSLHSLLSLEPMSRLRVIAVASPRGVNKGSHRSLNRWTYALLTKGGKQMVKRRGSTYTDADKKAAVAMYLDWTRITNRGSACDGGIAGHASRLGTASPRRAPGGYAMTVKLTYDLHSPMTWGVALWIQT